MSITTPLISVIVPVYNTELYLSECLNSIISQSYSNIEIIVVDDASTDASLSIVRDFANQDERIILYRHMINCGICKARNTGLRYAKGDYVAWCDSDDVLHPQFIEYLYSVLKKYGADFVECQYISNREFKPSQLANVVFEDFQVSVGDSKDFLKRFATHELQTSLWSKLFKRKLFDDFLFPVARLYEENYFYVYLFEHLNKAAYSSAQLYFYRQRDNSIMSTFKVRELKEGLKTTDLFYIFSNKLENKYKILFQQKTLKILLNYWQRIVGMKISFSSKIKWLKVVNHRMKKVGIKANDTSFFTYKERLIFTYNDNVTIFIFYYFFRKYIKRNI